MTLDISIIPENWFLHKLEHLHTPIKYKGQVHVPIGWLVELQRLEGGKLIRVQGCKLSEVLKEAVSKIFYA